MAHYVLCADDIIKRRNGRKWAGMVSFNDPEIGELSGPGGLKAGK
jgi:hypothetical protein